jgi:hypothetical protein
LRIQYYFSLSLESSFWQKTKKVRRVRENVVYEDNYERLKNEREKKENWYEKEKEKEKEKERG